MQTLQQLYIENPAFTAQDLLDEYNNQPEPIGTITINDAVNFDATYFIDEMIQDYLDDPEGDQDIKKIIVRFRKIINGLLPFINIGDVTTQVALDKIIENVGDFTQEMRDALEGMARQPKPVVTIEQCRAVINPPVTRDVTIASGNNQIVMSDGSMLGQSNNGGFRFKVFPNEDFTGTIKINVLAKKANDTVFEPFDQIAINISGGFTDGLPRPFAFARNALLKDYKHFNFTFDEPYANAVEKVEVENI